MDWLLLDLSFAVDRASIVHERGGCQADGCSLNTALHAPQPPHAHCTQNPYLHHMTIHPHFGWPFDWPSFLSGLPDSFACSSLSFSFNFADKVLMVLTCSAHFSMSSSCLDLALFCSSSKVKACSFRSCSRAKASRA